MIRDVFAFVSNKGPSPYSFFFLVLFSIRVARVYVVLEDDYNNSSLFFDLQDLEISKPIDNKEVPSFVIFDRGASINTI